MPDSTASSPYSSDSPGSGESAGGLSVRPRPRTSVLSAPTDFVDLASDATIVAGALHRTRGKGPLYGLASLGRLKFEAWLEDHMKDPILKKLEIRKEVAQAQKSAEEAQNQLKGTQHDGSRSIERHRIEMNEIRRQRLMSDLAAAVAPSLASAAQGERNGSGVVPIQITNEQIEALALRAAMNLGHEGDGSGDDSAWLSYRDELYAKMPLNIAKEIERRIHEIRAVMR